MEKILCCWEILSSARLQSELISFLGTNQTDLKNTALYVYLVFKRFQNQNWTVLGQFEAASSLERSCVMSQENSLLIPATRSSHSSGHLSSQGSIDGQF